MKKIAAFLILFSFSRSIAQPYQKMLADSVTKFHIVELYIPVRLQQPNNPQNANCINANMGDYFAQYDSSYGGKTYKKFFYGGGFLGLLREDTVAKKIYFIQYCNTTEELLYDFSLLTGDSIQYTFPYSNSYILSGWYKVDSIKYKHDYTSHYRKHFYLTNRLNSSWGSQKASLEMIEGVGNTNHPLFLYYRFNPGILGAWGPGNMRCFDTPYDQLLSCKWNNGIKVYFDSCAYSAIQGNPCVGIVDSCNYGNTCSGIAAVSNLKNINAYPNPASDVVTVEVESDKGFSLTYSLVNVLGVEVKKEKSVNLIKGKNAFSVNVKDLAEGIYVLKLSSGGAAETKTIIISR